jgi:hypothetical protein
MSLKKTWGDIGLVVLGGCVEDDTSWTGIASTTKIFLMLMIMVVTTENCDFPATRGPNPAGLVSIGPCSLSISIGIKESTKTVL